MNLSFSIKGISELTAAIKSIKDGPISKDAMEAARRTGANAPGAPQFDMSPSPSKFFNHQLLGQMRNTFQRIKPPPKVKFTKPGTAPDPDDDAPTKKKSWLGGNASAPGGLLRQMGAAMRFAQTGSAYQLGSLASLSATAGPVALALTAVAIQLKVFADGLKYALDAVNGSQARRFGAVATHQQQAAMDAISDAIGLDKGVLSGISAGKDGKATQLLAELKRVAMAPNEMGAMYAANQAGLPGEVGKLRGKSPEELKKLFSGEGHMIGPIEEQRAAKVQAWWNEILNRAEQFIIRAAFYITEGIQVIGMAIDAVKMYFQSFLQSIRDIPIIGKIFSGAEALAFTFKDAMITINPLTNLLSKVGSTIRDIWNGKDPLSQMDKLLTRQSDSIDKFSDAVDVFAYTGKSGVFGGMNPGQVAASYPSNWIWSWYQLQQQQMNDSLYLGAFTVA